MRNRLPSSSVRALSISLYSWLHSLVVSSSQISLEHRPPILEAAKATIVNKTAVLSMILRCKSKRRCKCMCQRSLSDQMRMRSRRNLADMAEINSGDAVDGQKLDKKYLTML